MSFLLEGLNEPQRLAVEKTTGPLLVLAGAGSGKTRVITHRAAYIASTVAAPRNVLAITFTNKAAGEMRARIDNLGYGREMTVCTFHSLGARLLRQYAAEADLDPNFTIFDESDRQQVVKKAIAAADLSTSNWSPRMVQTRISEAKNQLLSAADFKSQAEGLEYAEHTVARIYAAYQEMMCAQRAVDFDDLLCKTAWLLGRHPQVRSALEQRFQFVLIDEYQDTNHAQYMIARGLTLEHENICATGDPDQSIYAWRGADIRNILEFEHDFPTAAVVRLEQNYRSTKAILSAAGALIQANQQRKVKSLWTENQAGAAVRVVEREDAEDEADFLVEDIARHKQAGRSLSDIAVFYRVNALTRVIEEAFLRAGISYQIARGTEFYNRREIKDLLAYLRAVINPADEIAFARAVNAPARGIGKTTISRLVDCARAHHLAVFDAAARAQEFPELRRAASRLQKFVDLIAAIRERLGEPVGTVVEAVLELSGLGQEMRGSSAYGDDALDNVEELVSAAADFTVTNPEGTLAEWLHHISLVSDVDSVDPAAGAVTLMTLHAAKGLEFPVVYIIAVEDRLLPHANYLEDPAQLEEERRLCFVGITRAREELTLSYAKWRMMRGTTIRTTESQFLTELPQDEVDWHREQPLTQPRAEHTPTDTSGFRDWRQGMYLRHPAFGVGELLWKQRSGRYTRAGLRFPSYGEKTLILEFAKMQPLDPDECQL